uniref:DNA topoisomerase n=1 Tax=Parastrongyloides trichosuri TaxID=131310 RepID=A0A0N4ZWI6_PARTI
MSIAEHLYTHGYISYPRTETTQYPTQFDFRGILQNLAKDSRCSSYAQQVLNDGVRKPKRGDDKGDHPPITPMKSDEGRLSGDQARIYEYVTQHFIASLMKPCKYRTTNLNFSIKDDEFTYSTKHVEDPGFTSIMSWQAIEESSISSSIKKGSVLEVKNYLVIKHGFMNMTTNLKFSIKDEEFTYSTKHVEDPGFTSIMSWQAIEESSISSSINKGSVLEVKNLSIVEKETSPPGYLTESELITQMEKFGIGTDASIPVHIGNIIQRNYATVESGRRIIPTKLGVSLIHGYCRIDPELVLPTMRSEVGEQLNLIAKGQADYELVKEHVLSMFRTKFVYFTENVRGMDELFEDSFTTLDACGKPFSRCGKCLRFMKLVDSKPQRLHCNNCNETYNIPISRTGVIKQYNGDKRCPVDQFGILHWSENIGNTIKSYPFCPHCFNNPPFEDMDKKVGCNKCPHASCEFSSIGSGVINCFNPDCGGIIYYDKLTKPKYKFNCNKCAITIELFKGAYNLKLHDKECFNCGANHITVEYKENSPLPDGVSKFTGCLFCNGDIYNNSILVKVKDYTKSIENASNRMNSYRGGRGRGGRGRGRGSRGRGSRGR